ncbi:MAG: DUF4129 domain-containing protein [Gemmatimonadaceae bacterium]
MRQIGNEAIADTVAAVFRGKDFVEHRSFSIGGIIASWIWSFVTRFLGYAASHPVVGLILRIALGAVVLLILARVVYGLLIHYAPSAIGRERFDPAHTTDWFRTAQERASQQDYTGAAHALYLALLGSAARRGLVSLHESKTTGDYLRELRRKPDAIDLPSFTDFTRSYETVIYGIGVCDERRFASLSALAAGLLNILPSRNNKHAQGSSGSHHAAP